MIRQVLRDEGRPIAGPPTFDDLRAAESILKSRDREQKLRKRRGRLVDREQARAAFFSEARRVRDSWQQWPARISALLAARLGVDPHVLERELDAEVSAHLRTLATVDVADALSEYCRFSGR